jgi:hypothetical protein
LRPSSLSHTPPAKKGPEASSEKASTFLTDAQIKATFEESVSDGSLKYEFLSIGQIFQESPTAYPN